MSDVTKEDNKAWTDFIRASDALIKVLGGDHTLHKMIMNDIDHHAVRVRAALDTSTYFWRYDCKKARPKAIVLLNAKDVEL